MQVRVLPGSFATFVPICGVGCCDWNVLSYLNLLGFAWHRSGLRRLAWAWQESCAVTRCFVWADAAIGCVCRWLAICAHRKITTPAIAQLVEHLTVDAADIRWSLVRFRVAGFGCQVFQLTSGSCCIACAYFWIAFFSSLTEQTAYQGKEGIEPCMPPNLNIDVSSSACLAILVKRNFMSMGTWPQATHQVPSRNST